MAAVSFTIDSPRHPDEVIGALTDFTDRRPDLWPSIDRSVYTVHEVGDGFAEATEGSDVMGGIWARERYEWSNGHVRATLVESNFWHPGGTWQATITPHDGGGSRIEVTRDRDPKVLKARILEAMMRIVGAKILAADLAKAPAITGERTT